MKKRAWMCWLVIFILYAVFTGTFFAARKILGSCNLEYRSNFVSLSYIVIWLVPWLFGLFLIIRLNKFLRYKRQQNRWFPLTIILLVIYLVIMVLVSAFWGVVGILKSSTEYREGDILKVTYSVSLRDTETYYCDIINSFLRRPFEWDSEREIALLEEKYHMTFTLSASDDGVRRYVPEAYPGVEIRISDYVPLSDDFPEKLASWYFSNTCETGQIHTLWQSKKDTASFDDTFELVLTDENNLETYAKDAARLIETACRDSFFDTNTGWLSCRMIIGGQEHTFALYFGAYKPFAEDGKPSDYYADPQNVLTRMKEEWHGFETDIREYVKDSEKEAALEDNDNKDSTSKDVTGQDDSAAYAGMLTDSEESHSSAAALLYENLTGSSEGFVESYNAKDNLYVVISREDIQENGQTLTKQISIVYDRICTNGKYYLFALYEDTLDETNNKVSDTKMLDYYAVNQYTREVISSGKHSYSTTGSTEYQEATGEL